MSRSNVSSIKPAFTKLSSVKRPAPVKPQTKKRPPPLSVRLSPEQRAQLERDAVGMSLNAYVLSCLFCARPKRKRSHQPSKRDMAISRALRRLSHAGLAAYLTSQIVAQEEGRLRLSKREEVELRHAHGELGAVRRDLIVGLGLQAE